MHVCKKNVPLHAKLTSILMEQSKKTGFNSKLGVILAAAGSAIGLGNIWKFPSRLVAHHLAHRPHRDVYLMDFPSGHVVKYVTIRKKEDTIRKFFHVRLRI